MMPATIPAALVELAKHQAEDARVGHYVKWVIELPELEADGRRARGPGWTAEIAWEGDFITHHGAEALEAVCRLVADVRKRRGLT